MDFLVELENKSLNRSSVDDKRYEYDEEFDTILSLFHDISNAFYERNVEMRLLINGEQFQTHSSELSIFLESFHDLVFYINKSPEVFYEFDFFEQGINYLLKFKKLEERNYELIFIERSTEISKEIYVNGTFVDLNLMLYTFYYRFVFLSNFICPAISKLDLFMEWRESVEKALNIGHK